MSARRRLVLVSPDALDEPTLARLEEILPGLSVPVDCLILRWKSGTDAERVAAARRLRAVSPRPALLLRDRFDLACAAQLEGVHLGEDGLDPSTVRAHWPGALIGVSRHDEQGLKYRSEGADFALVAPVFATPTKPAGTPLGLERFTSMCAGAALPVLALGGITAARVNETVRAGASGVAVRSAILGDRDPVRAAVDLRNRLDSAGSTPPDDELVAGSDG